MIELRVQPEQLTHTAKELAGAIACMRRDFARLNQCISSTKAYWLGDAGDYHRKLYEEQEGQIENLLRDLEKYPDDLLKLAGLYNENEEKNVRMARALKSSLMH